MFARQHIILTQLTVMPFVIPLLFLGVDKGIILSFMLFVFLGSLLPDADADGNPAISRFRLLYHSLRILVIKPVVLFFRLFVRSKHDVEDIHRGIMHSPLGVLFSTAFITTVLGAIMKITGYFNWQGIVIAFLGVYLGQILHLLEDSCTPGGINWAFPFGTIRVTGNIHTHDLQKHAKLKDMRPFFFYMILLSIICGIVLAYWKIPVVSDLHVAAVYAVILPIVFFSWAFILYVAKSDSSLWRLG